MLVNQTLYSIIEKLKATVKAECSIWDLRGKCLAATCNQVDGVKEDMIKFLRMVEYRDMQITERSASFAVRGDKEVVWIFVIHEAIENIEIIGKLCVSQIEMMNRLHEKRIDLNRFVQQLLLDNLLLVDIYNQAKKLHIENELKRVVFVIEPTNSRDDLVLETMKGMIAEEKKELVTSVDEGRFVLIKSLEENDSYEEVQQIAMAIVDVLATEAIVDARVAYGNIVSELKDISKSFKEASLALDVGRIFYKDHMILAYNQLGIGRLIHQLPISLCEMFLQEVFNGKPIEQFDSETIDTVKAFFKNNLNISKTADRMFLHRNTLGYRLDKVTKTTGLDVKTFEDAMTFQIALMVSEHMKFIKSQE